MKKLILTLTLSFLAVNAGAEDWAFSAGLNLRGFGDFAFDKFTFANPAFGVSYNGVRYVDGSIDSNAVRTVYKVIDPNKQVEPPGLEVVTFRSAEFNGGSEDIDRGAGVVLNAERRLDSRGRWSFHIDFSLTTAHSDTGAGFVVTEDLDSYDIGEKWSIVPQGTERVTANDPVPVPTSITARETVSRAHYKADIDAFTLGVGCVARIDADRFNVNFGIGPAVHLVDYAVARRESVRWADGGTIYERQETDDSTDVRLGGYASAGLQVPVWKQTNVEIEGRYDWVPDKITTALGNAELSGASAQIKLVHRF